MGVTLDDLCRPAVDKTLPNGKTVRVRALSDVERRTCDMEALALSARLARALGDKESREYQAYILPTLLEGSDERKRDAIVAYRSLTAVRESNRTVQSRYIPFPDNATDEERREVIDKRQAESLAVLERRAAETKRLIDETRQQIAEMIGETLDAKLEREAKNAISSGLYSDEFVRHTIYHACEFDGGAARFFASVEAVRSLPVAILNFLWDAYNEVDSIDPFLLASPSVTESSTAG